MFLNPADTPDELIEICYLFYTLKVQAYNTFSVRNLKSLEMGACTVRGELGSLALNSGAAELAPFNLFC